MIIECEVLQALVQTSTEWIQIMITLRKATNQDVETIVRIISASRLEYLPFAKSPHSLDGDRRWVAGKLIPTGGVVIARSGEKGVGVLATSVSEDFGWIDQLYIAPGYVGRGIGTALLSHALGFLPRPIHLWTFQGNDRAIGFYEHHGFKAIKYTDGENNEEKCPDILYEYR